MKHFLVTIVLLGTSPLFAQTPYRIITRPKIPSQEVTERLGLGFGWHARVPLDSPRDSVFSVQVIPRGSGQAIATEVVVQTVAGAVYLFDGETGTLRWNTPVGIRYRAMQPAAYNEQSIIVTRHDTFFVLNRDTGVQRVFRKLEGIREYGVSLGAIPSAAPAATDDLVAFVFPDRVSVFDLRPKNKAPDLDGVIHPEPLPNYFDPTMKLNTPAVITPTQIAVATADGRVISLAARTRQVLLRPRFEFRALSGITAAMGDTGDMGYIGSQDYYLYALNLNNERLKWRFASGAPILRRPEVNEADVFVVSEGRGMFRIDRTTGIDLWLEPRAVRFLAAHYSKDAQGKFKRDRDEAFLAKYVYAADRHGQLLILDGDRGGVLAQYDTSDWQTPVNNEWTDRFYLANQDGQVLCLRPRDSRLPQVNKWILVPRLGGDDRLGTFGVISAPAAPAPKKDEDKKDDDKMADDKMASNPASYREFTRPEVSSYPFAATCLKAVISRDDRIMRLS